MKFGLQFISRMQIFSVNENPVLLLIMSLNYHAPSLKYCTTVHEKDNVDFVYGHFPKPPNYKMPITGKFHR